LLGARLAVASGVLPVEQSPQALAAVRSKAETYDAWRLAATAHATALAGSAILALMLAEGAMSAEDVFSASQIDEAYQAGRWGEDGEAIERAEGLKAELIATGRFIAALSA
jgi:chaperone required for assembly of F1-ATPase